MKAAVFVACAVTVTSFMSVPAKSADISTGPVSRAEGWFAKSYDQIDLPGLQTNVKDDEVALKAITAKSTAADIARFKWWAVGGPAYRWNEIIIDELLDNFVTLPLAARHLALFHAALDDAVAVTWRHRKSAGRPGPLIIDPLIKATIQGPEASSFPSDYAAAAAAASEVLAYIFPTRAKEFAARAEEAMQVRLLAGVEYPSDVAAGRIVGQKIAALAIARGQSDQSDAKWSGSVPEGPGKWKGSNPIAPLTATWKPWVLSRPDEFRPSAPPAFDSEAAKDALGELKTFPRTTKTNHRAIYWEVYGGARAHALWNEIARMKVVEHGANLPSLTVPRVFAALNIAFQDAATACWDAKYAYWYIRPSQLDADVQPVFALPNHPSHPAAHG